MGNFFSDIFGTKEKEYEFAPTQWLQDPEYAEATGARQDWASRLKEWGSMPGYGAIAPDWGDIWSQAQKRIKQYYWGGAGGQTGLSEKVKASAARRNVAESPALETELTKMGYEEAGKQGELATTMATKEAEFGETGRQNWMGQLMRLAGLNVPGQWQTAGYKEEEPSGAAGWLGQLIGSAGPEIATLLGSAGTEILSGLGTVGAGLFGMFSDKHLKDNIIKIGSTKLGLNIYRWNWKPWAKVIVKNSPTIGLIAQEVMKIKPEAVFMDKSGYLKINYTIL